MTNEKNPLKTIVVSILAIYMISVLVMTPHYYRKEVREHEGWLRAEYWSPTVAFFKGMVWPYYVFIKDDDGGEPPDVEMLASSFEDLLSAKLLWSAPSASPYSGDNERILDLLQRSLDQAEKIDLGALNDYQPGLGDAVRDHYLVALRSYIRGFSEGWREQDIRQGAAAITRYNLWVEQNVPAD
jgi:hypothetical protein